LAGAGEQHGVPLDQCPVGDVLRDGRFPDAVRANQNDVGGVVEELQRHRRVDGGPIATLWPGPVEIAKRFEPAEMGRAGAPLQTATGAFLFLPAEQPREPGLGGDFVPVRQQPVQIERRGSGTLWVGFSHRIGP
jgi:hypothetical protein